MSDYVLFYCTIGSPSRPKGQRGPIQEYSFKAENDEDACKHVRKFCAEKLVIKRKPRRLYKNICL